MSRSLAFGKSQTHLPQRSGRFWRAVSRMPTYMKKRARSNVKTWRGMCVRYKGLAGTWLAIETRKVMGGGGGEKAKGVRRSLNSCSFSSVWFQPHPRRCLWEAWLMLLTHGFFSVLRVLILLVKTMMFAGNVIWLYIWSQSSRPLQLTKQLLKGNR